MAIRMVGREVGKRALVVRRYRPVPPVLADESRLGQVFLNLLMNAAQAIPTGERDDHLIRVSTDTDPSGDVVIEVSDTGTGISAPAAHQLFEPFFTTRSDGTGLGLAICREIVDELGGDIRFQSAAGRGTTFRIVLPHPPEPTQGGPH